MGFTHLPETCFATQRAKDALSNCPQFVEDAMEALFPSLSTKEVQLRFHDVDQSGFTETLMYAEHRANQHGLPRSTPPRRLDEVLAAVAGSMRGAPAYMAALPLAETVPTAVWFGADPQHVHILSTAGELRSDRDAVPDDATGVFREYSDQTMTDDTLVKVMDRCMSAFDIMVVKQ